ncbi:MAG: PmoA family protein [Planctomycetes bacterium]|nr:PmoA family protein [Planctomycetota bacterium]
MALKIEVVPEKAVVVRREKVIVAASWYGPSVLRPFVYPFLGPGDRELTRLGHPEDPVGHSHHRSIWIGHHDVSGVSFWEESPAAGRIEQLEAAVLQAEGEVVKVRIELEWLAPGRRPVLSEKRTLAFADLGGGELALEIDCELRAASKDGVVTLGDTPFGLLGIRVARTMRVAERLGGKIVNSQEAEDEKGCFWQHADWCDYSGPVPAAGPIDPKERDAGRLPALVAGIACFAHPESSPEDTLWHVRDDGWMGPCISKGKAREIPPGGLLRARYRLEAHRGDAAEARVGERYRRWRKGQAKG